MERGYTPKYLIRFIFAISMSHTQVSGEIVTSQVSLPVKLPDHLDQYAKISAELRQKMNPALQAILELTDKTALRCAAVPEMA
jgi:hypothetical protein